MPLVGVCVGGGWLKQPHMGQSDWTLGLGEAAHHHRPVFLFWKSPEKSPPWRYNITGEREKPRPPFIHFNGEVGWC